LNSSLTILFSVQSDATVKFFVNHFGAKEYELQIIEVNISEDGSVVHHHRGFTPQGYSGRNNIFRDNKCGRSSTGCKAMIFVPQTAKPGIRLAIQGPEPHTCCVSFLLPHQHQISCFRQKLINLMSLAEVST
jgi:hypothetical protein